MSQKSIALKHLDKAITSDDLLGKDVIDLGGKFIGISEKVLIDPDSLDFIGIEVDKGFLRKGLTIGKDYIERIAPYAIFLNVRVAYEIKGMEVFDKKGKLIGKVSDIELVENKNKIKNIKVKTKIIGRALIIPVELIDSIGYSVLLNVEKKELTQQE